MAQEFSLSQLLRPVGQMLEPMSVDSFALRVESGGVKVRAQKRAEPKATPPPELSLRVVWQSLRGKKAEPQDEPKPSSGLVELSYTHEDIARIDSEGRAKRKETGGKPDAHAISQVLRAIGAYVDQKQGQLLSVTKDGQELKVEYNSLSKQTITENFTVSSLYDFWIKMYLRRRDRG